MGRAFSALTLVEGTVNVARKHALQLIHIEQKLHIFRELDIQHFFLQYPTLMTWINRLYSFIHIPGTILFLVWLYWFTTTTTNLPGPTPLYAARRRTMATCNLLAFIIFTLWPCMPPRLLSDPTAPANPTTDEARAYGFVDTVHSGPGGGGSVWTTNKFCNQYAAMPSLHFGYSLLIGLTILSVPLPPRQSRSLRISNSLRLRVPGLGRAACVAVGVAYPTAILVAIVATANHFVLDAVAGAVVCGVAWASNGVLLNLVVVEDWFLWGLRVCKPESLGEGEEGEGEWVKGGLP